MEFHQASRNWENSPEGKTECQSSPTGDPLNLWIWQGETCNATIDSKRESKLIDPSLYISKTWQ
jgi:hypothetical protein